MHDLSKQPSQRIILRYVCGSTDPNSKQRVCVKRIPRVVECSPGGASERIATCAFPLFLIAKIYAGGTCFGFGFVFVFDVVFSVGGPSFLCRKITHDLQIPHLSVPHASLRAFPHNAHGFGFALICFSQTIANFPP